jgi:hypothetical protein
LWVLLSRVWSGWREAVQIVKPATVVSWHRRLFAWHWRWRSAQPRLGRPPIPVDVRALIHKMYRANPLWGAPRIHGELRKLGCQVITSHTELHRVWFMPYFRRLVSDCSVPRALAWNPPSLKGTA